MSLVGYTVRAMVRGHRQTQACGGCGKQKGRTQYVFSGWGVPGQYCSDCRRVYRGEYHETAMDMQRLRRAGIPTPRDHDTCQNPACDADITNRRRNAKYCSVKCCNAVAAARRSKEREEARGRPWRESD